MACEGIRLLRPRPQGRARPGRRHLFKPLRQIIESVNDTFKASLTWNGTAATRPAE